MHKFQLPSGSRHKWRCKWTGEQYTTNPDGTPITPRPPRREACKVKGGNAYQARIAASVRLGVPPEFVQVELLEKEPRENKKKFSGNGAGSGGKSMRHETL